MRISQCTLVVLSAFALLTVTACQKEPEPTPPPQAQEQAPNPHPAPPAPPVPTPNPQSAPPASPAPTPEPPSSPSLIREPAAPQQQQDPAAQAIQSKPFGEGGTLALTKVKVVGQILNVEFMFIPAKNENGGYKYTIARTGKVADFAYIDESTSKRISLLQDENGKYMVDPSPQGKDISVSGSSPRIVALKFPAPAATTPTITIDFPGAGSFDSVPVSR